MGGYLSMLMGNSWPPLKVVAEFGDKVCDNEEDNRGPPPRRPSP